jgi:hypothetical protein
MTVNLTPYHTFEEDKILPTETPTGTHSNLGQLRMSSMTGGKKRKMKKSAKKLAKRKSLGKRKTVKRKTNKRRK